MSANVSILGNLGRNPETRITPDGSGTASQKTAEYSVETDTLGDVQEVINQSLD